MPLAATVEQKKRSVATRRRGCVGMPLHCNEVNSHGKARNIGLWKYRRENKPL